MKTYILLILSAVTLAFMAGYYILFIKGNYIITNEESLAIDKIKRILIHELNPEVEIDFTRLYNDPYKEQLITLKEGQVSISSKEIEILVSSKNCASQTTNQLIYSLQSPKYFIWEEFRCSPKKVLPDNFFKTPPYLHPSGISYAYLAYISNNKTYKSREWLEENLSYFHLREFHQLNLDFSDLPQWIEIIAQLRPLELDLLLSGETFFKTNKYLFYRVSSFYSSILPTTFAFPELRYRIFDFNAINEIVNDKTIFNIREYKSNRPCYKRDGQICWEYSFTQQLKVLNKGSLIFVVFLTVVIAIIILNLVNRIAAQRKEEERKKLALQILSHEMRTPASSIILSVETINQSFDTLPEPLVEPFIRISNEAFRLKRLIEKSRQYLATSHDSKLIQTQGQTIPSIKELIFDIVDNYKNDEITTEIEDSEIHSDPYWLGVLITNLLENAIYHGVKPISIIGKKKDSSYFISIIDQGQVDLPPLKQLAREFQKGTSSKGSGLGLTIVSKIAAALNAQLTLSNKPTTFTIVISNPKENV